MTISPETTLTLEEAARVARCHVDTIRHKCRSGVIPFFRTGGLGKIRIRADDFTAFLKSEQKQQPRAHSA